MTGVIVRDSRAVAVRTADGREVEARRAVLANTSAPALFLDLLDRCHVPSQLLDDLKRFEWDSSTVKVDWTLDGRIPWEYEAAREAGTVHIADGLDAMSEHTTQIQNRRIPARPFLVAGQYAGIDPTRSPEGKETFWAYSHVPRTADGDAGGDGLTGAWDEREAELFADRIELEVEQHAPGFRELIRGRHIKTPKTLERMNANLVGGAINNGTAQVHQQLVFRPTPGTGRPETPVKDLYLTSAAAHPGGGVHGAPGATAARAALRSRRVARRVIDLGRRVHRTRSPEA